MSKQNTENSIADLQAESNKDVKDLLQDEAALKEKKQQESLAKALKVIQETAKEDDPHPAQQLTLRTVRTILGGDLLSAELVRSQIWLILLIVAFTVCYVALRYQGQQNIVTIQKMETELKDAKNKALAASSTLTEKCRESRILDLLKQDKDSLLHIADQPPYIIQIPEE